MSKNWIYILLVSLFAIGCGESEMHFAEPQPSFAKTLNEFPTSLQGDYALESDSQMVGSFTRRYPNRVDTATVINAENHITISSNSIFNYVKGSIGIDFKLLDSTDRAEFENEKSIDEMINMYYKRPNFDFILTSMVDSIVTYDVSIIDTMFYVSDINIIKKYKENIYLNMSTGDTTWFVIQIKSSDPNTISYNSTSDEDETVLERIMELNNEPFDKSSASPSKKSMKKFIKMGGWESEIELKKIN
ncbi:MAG: hypothetical protein HRT71_07425 [Flavobacteriales bacterium]|nr:hypothetical protein [Flavobacteriales bacterium]